MIDGPRKPPLKAGTTETIDIQTGEVLEVKRNAMTLLPPPPDVCQECGHDHPHDQPHNLTLYYRMAFAATHGRGPTWTDAMRHCAPEVQAAWREHLVAEMRAQGLVVPEDLVDPKAKGR